MGSKKQIGCTGKDCYGLLHIENVSELLSENLWE